MPMIVILSMIRIALRASTYLRVRCEDDIVCFCELDILAIDEPTCGHVGVGLAILLDATNVACWTHPKVSLDRESTSSVPRKRAFKFRVEER